MNICSEPMYTKPGAIASVLENSFLCGSAGLIPVPACSGAGGGGLRRAAAGAAHAVAPVARRGGVGKPVELAVWRQAAFTFHGGVCGGAARRPRARIGTTHCRAGWLQVYTAPKQNARLPIRR